MTGATGCLGSHILAEALHPASGYSRVVCLVRARNNNDPSQRVFAQLRDQKLDSVLAHGKNKLKILPADLAAPNLGVNTENYAMLQNSVTNIIHAAWTINFNLPLSAFVATDLQGLHNLINLSLTTNRRCTIAFTSSISVAGISAAARKSKFRVPEELITDFHDCAPSGYARSKLVAEHMVFRARKAHGVEAFILRIGQIVGSLVGGKWNTNELVPLMVRSAIQTGTMPVLPADLVSWLPVDVCARVVLEILASSGEGSVFNVLNPTCLSWKREFLPALNAAGVACRGVTPKEWVVGLREHAERQAGAAELNPAVRLLDFWEQVYGRDNERLVAELVFDSTQAQQASKSLERFAKEGAGHVVNEGYVARFVKEWMASWKI